MEVSLAQCARADRAVVRSIDSGSAFSTPWQAKRRRPHADDAELPHSLRRSHDSHEATSPRGGRSHRRLQRKGGTCGSECQHAEKCGRSCPTDVELRPFAPLLVRTQAVCVL